MLAFDSQAFNVSMVFLAFYGRSRHSRLPSFVIVVKVSALKPSCISSFKDYCNHRGHDHSITTSYQDLLVWPSLSLALKLFFKCPRFTWTLLYPYLVCFQYLQVVHLIVMGREPPQTTKQSPKLGQETFIWCRPWLSDVWNFTCHRRCAGINIRAELGHD